jgi:HSP20 family protein
MLMRQNDPFDEAFSLRDMVNRLFNEAFVRPSALLAGSVASVRVSVLEREGRYFVKALLPGVHPDQVDVTAQGATITIKGTVPPAFATDEVKQGTVLFDEIGSGSFTRSITLPNDIAGDRIEASYDQGVLTLTIPVAEHAQPKRIAIKAQPQLAAGSSAASNPA